jgi:hypothetical protein
MEKLRNAKIWWQKSHREIKESTNHGKMKYGTYNEMVYHLAASGTVVHRNLHRKGVGATAKRRRRLGGDN